jgi:broad specificity phosphatase PhoE
MRLILARHGETENNASRVTMGRADVPLNERGLRQAATLAAALAADGRFGRIEAVYSSPLQRARSTAEAIASQLGLVVETLPELIEMDVGELEGHGYAEVRERYAGFMRVWASDDLADAVMPGGESLRQVQDRARVALDALLARHPEGTVVAVTHNFVSLTLLCHALALPLAQFRRLRQDVASFSVIEASGERLAVLAMNDGCHLVTVGG